MAVLLGFYRAEILRFFDGCELVDPGLVCIPRRRPDSHKRDLYGPGRCRAAG